MSALHIRELRLRNYRSFRDARLPLSDLTFLVGRNASGKSSLLDALDFIREALTDSLPIAIERRGGMEGLRHRLAADDELVEVAVVLSLVLDVDEKGGFVSTPHNTMHIGLDRLPTCSVVYGFSLDRQGMVGLETLRSEDDRLPGYLRSAAGLVPVAGTERWEPSVPMDVLLLPLLGGQGAGEGARAVSVQGSGWQSFYPGLVRGSLASFRSVRPRSSAIIDGRELGAGDVLAPDGRNLADIVHQMREREPKLLSAVLVGLQAVTPGIESIDTVTLAGRRHLQFHQRLGSRVAVFQVSAMSEGTLRALALLCSFHQPRSASLIAVDEVEDALHVGALFAIVEQALAVTEEPHSGGQTVSTQVLLTTHSTEVLSLPMATGERIRILENRDGASWIFALSPDVMADLQPPETVGRLLRINALWPDEEPLVNGPDLFALPA